MSPSTSKSAGFAQRLLALIIDFVAIGIPLLIGANTLLLSVEPEDYSEPTVHETGVEDFVGYLLILFVLTVAFASFWSFGRSPGLFLTGLRAQADDGGRVRLSKAAMRGFMTAAFLVSGFVLFAGGFADSDARWNAIDSAAVLIAGSIALVGLIGYMSLFVNVDRKTFQDRASGVRVVSAGRRILPTVTDSNADSNPDRQT